MPSLLLLDSGKVHSRDWVRLNAGRDYSVEEADWHKPGWCGVLEVYRHPPSVQQLHLRNVTTTRGIWTRDDQWAATFHWVCLERLWRLEIDSHPICCLLCYTLRRLLRLAESIHWAVCPADTRARVHLNLELPELLYWHSRRICVPNRQSVHSGLVEMLPTSGTGGQASFSASEWRHYGGQG